MRAATGIRWLAVLAVVALAAVALLNRGSTASAPLPAAVESRSPASSAPQRVTTIGPVPIVRQRLRNNCETAALSMLLAAAGKPVGQLVLQRALPKSGPLDPIVAADGTWTWGDPDLGFVGRGPGGGTAGGFGVYQGPIRRLAASYGVRLDDVSRKPLQTILERLRRGRPVMTWVALSEGPYTRWTTPAGKRIGVNFGEHTVVLTGVRGDVVRVNDPLEGVKTEWPLAVFVKKWELLGRRALAM